jgi:hypothetical protein
MSAAVPPTTHESRTVEQEKGQAGLLEKGKKLLGLKKEEGEGGQQEREELPANNTRTMLPATSGPTLMPSPPLTTSPGERRASPRGSPRVYAAGMGASPSRRVRSTSPGLHSPASSQIFERNVQEPAEPSPAIPNHIQTEDHIPAALDASSIAITDKQLNPDEVEIIMHAAHQPASVAVAQSVSEAVHSPSLSHDELVGSHADLAETAANPSYGSLDTTDPRRLSFISFADVVQAEHAETDRDAVQFMSLSSTVDRSPSPVLSPAPSHDFSASGAQSPPLTGDLQIETMRQALRRTGSGDLSGARSQAPSAVSLEEASIEHPTFK